MWPGKDIVLAFGLLSLCIGSALGSVFLYMAPIYLDRFRGFHLVLLLEISCFSTGPHAWCWRSGRMYVTKNQSFPSLHWLSLWRKTLCVKGSLWARKAWNHFYPTQTEKSENSLSTTAFQFSICTKLQSVFMDRRFSWMLVKVLFLQESNNSGVLGSSFILQLTADTFHCWF